MGKYYEAEVIPILEMKAMMPVGPPENSLRLLKLCSLVQPEDYPRFKKMLMEEVERQHQFKEPNLERYYDRMDEIFADIESGM